ncbi:MJ1255/VC2487 family glycosyltransferase [Alteromonas sp. CYL-A6]|uniref:MJ1255/VC2487 family glycosyltransferase n=1 Tax=Alteromonas nitratireducens TaxID=3390813 RepID=UPI0034BFC3EA
MKILYGVQGTGNGHITRARVMAEAFAKRDDVDVDFVFSGRPADKYFDMDVFGRYRTYTGLSFVTSHGRVDRIKTLRQAKAGQFIRDVRAFDVSSYDLLINDFEPLTAWAAKRAGLPSISISHQAAFTYNVPRAGETLTDKLIMRFFAPTDIKLGVHWYHFNQPIVPPFIEDTPTPHCENRHVLVYLPFEDTSEIRLMLEPLSDQHFICFHPDVSVAHSTGHIQWQPTAKAAFHHALQHCSGVIANAGFELSSEALQLGKKLLIKPLLGQFEQLSNVMTLDKLGLCQTLFVLDTDTVEEWLATGQTEAVEFPRQPDVLIDWLIQGDWRNTQPLCDALWKQVKFGSQTREKLMSLAI